MSSYYTLTPPTKLGRYRVLSPNASAYVFLLQLEGASIGDKWNNIGMGEMEKDASIKLDAYYDAGGNFIDTACNYQNGTSEEFIGEWMERRGIRDEMVISTEYTSFAKQGDPSVSIKINYAGNGHKRSWDASMEEVMTSLHNLVMARKVLYLGISDTPANLEALDIKLTPEHIKSLESLLSFEPGFPHNLVGDGSSVPRLFFGVAPIDKWERMPALPAVGN